MEIYSSEMAGSDLKMANDGTITIPRLNIWGRLYLIAPNPFIGLPHHLSFILEILNLIQELSCGMLPWGEPTY